MVDSSDFRFIEQNPNIPSKNPSLPKEQWEELKPRIVDLLGKGVSIADILRQLELSHIHVTRSQINTQMKKWGLSKDSVQLLQGAMILSQGPSVTNKESTELQAPISQVEGLLIDNQVPTEGALADLQASALKQLECLELGTDSINRPEATDTSRSFSEKWGNLSGEPAPDTAVEVPVVGEPGPSEPAYLRYRMLFSSSTFADGTHASGLKSVARTYPPLDMPSYELVGTSLEYQQRLMSISLFMPEGSSLFNRLNYMATLLFSMRCYPEAFEIFFIITSALNDVLGVNIWIGRYFLFSAMNCVRSAWTREQRIAAEDLVEQLQTWAKKIQLHGDPYYVRHVQAFLQNKVNGQEIERLDQTAYWTAGSALFRICSGMPAVKFEVFTARPSIPIAYFYRSPDFQRTMISALSIIHEMLWKAGLKGFFRDVSWNNLRHVFFCMLLKDIGPWNTESLHLLRRLHWSKESQPIRDQFLGQAVMTLSFVTSSQVEYQHINEFTESPENGLWRVDLLESTFERLERTLKAGPGSSDYKKVIDEYLRLSSRQTNEQILNPSYRLSLARFAAAVADVEPITAEPKTFRLPSWSVRHTIDPTTMDTSFFAPNFDLSYLEPWSSFARDSSLDSTLARSLRSSTSSFRLFKSAAHRSTASLSQNSMRTTSTDRSSDRMSWRFSVVTGMSSNPSIR